MPVGHRQLAETGHGMRAPRFIALGVMAKRGWRDGAPQDLASAFARLGPPLAATSVTTL